MNLQLITKKKLTYSSLLVNTDDLSLPHTILHRAIEINALDGGWIGYSGWVLVALNFGEFPIFLSPVDLF